jgi:hypothetical protein
MENVEGIRDAATGNWQAQKVIEQIQSAGKINYRELQENKIAAFAAFLNTL